MNDTPLDELQKYLQGVVYPTTRDVVVQTAERNGAPANTLQRLSALKSRVSGPHEVMIVLREGGWTVRDTQIRQGAQQQ